LQYLAFQLRFINLAYFFAIYVHISNKAQTK
jgi:hypothetical protein